MSFFVQSLGPAVDESNAQAIYAYVKKKAKSRTLSEAELSKLITDCITESRGTGLAAGGIKALKTHGYIVLAKDGKYQLVR